MPILIKHSKVSTIPDDADTSLVRPSDWNADHTFTGLGTMAEQDANNVAITGGTITGIAITASPAGLNTEIQYNNSGSLGANANFTYTGSDVNIPFGTSNSATSTAKIALALSMIA
jgi:hypothetical protein